MSRPAPKNLLRTRVGRTTREISVNQAAGYWIVVLDHSTPVNFVQHELWGSDSVKYMKNGWANPAAARNFADKMNRWFNTQRFSVLQVL